MALSPSLNDREFAKFEETPEGDTAVRVTGSNFSGSFTFSGLSEAGRFTEVEINDSTWTALPSGGSALPNRNAVSVQNQSTVNIKLNYINSVGYVGVKIPADGERQYDIQGDITIYARSEPGSGTVTIGFEELA